VLLLKRKKKCTEWPTPTVLLHTLRGNFVLYLQTNLIN
jgi:hypothetical protein